MAATRAKLLARRGQFDAAMRLAEEAVEQPRSIRPAGTGRVPDGASEVSHLAGVLEEAEACIRQALRFYENRQMVLLAEPARALFDSLTERHSTLKP